MSYISSIQKESNQLLIININASDKYSENYIASTINEEYDKLSNFHHIAIIFNDDHNIISWSTIYKTAIFMEQFKKEEKFKLFNKNREKKVKELCNFIKTKDEIYLSREIIDNIESYYNSISYGFQFQDLFISENGKTKILIMQKIELDEAPKKCPSCLQEIVRGNSYPKLLHKSFECQNASCPSRSKMSRGKRYDLFSAKRQIMLHRNSELDFIDDLTYSNFRRDIFLETKNLIENIILLYSWSGDRIKIINSKINSNDNFKGREIVYGSIKNELSYISIDNLSIYKLFYSIAENIKKPFEKIEYSYKKINNSFIINGDSSKLLYNFIMENNIYNLGGAVTSPPYYNAREYSQWDNMLCYLIDMMINASSVFYNLKDKSKYIYNIGDIVGQDNIFISSKMSNRRQMLGFYSMLIFEIIGYSIKGNVIWDKGEVQSKRNSSPNRISGYIKPINSYEHCIVFNKGKTKNLLPTTVQKIEPVRKINSQGKNILGHSAPYPIEIPQMLIPFINENEYILDPFLGSGTTIISLSKHVKGIIGFELNYEYFNLAKERIKKL